MKDVQLFFNPLRQYDLKCISILIPYRAVNTLYHSYKMLSVNAVHLLLGFEIIKPTEIHSVCERYTALFLNINLDCKLTNNWNNTFSQLFRNVTLRVHITANTVTQPYFLSTYFITETCFGYLWWPRILLFIVLVCWLYTLRFNLTLILTLSTNIGSRTSLINRLQDSRQNDG
jgi:hypothetical protein